MITELGVKRATRVLTEAGFRLPKDMDVAVMAKRWIDVITSLDDDSVERAAAEYARSDHPAYAWPTPGQLVECARHLSNNADSRYYDEPKPEAAPARPEQIRGFWEAADIDLEDLKRANRAMRARRGDHMKERHG